MLEIISGLLLLAAADAPDCAGARNLYESLALERALDAADATMARAGRRSPDCLEVKGLVATILGQADTARSAFEELFTADPDHPIDDPALSPSMRETIESIRAGVRPLRATVRARWLIHESLAVEVVLEGGLRGAKKLRYRAEVRPGGDTRLGELELIGRTATATVAVPARAPIDAVAVKGLVLSADGRELLPFDAVLPVPGRPAAREPERVVVTVDSGIPWPVWAGLGAAAVAGTVLVIVLAQPSLPDGAGTVGRLPVNP